MKAYREGDRVRLGNIAGVIITFFDQSVLLYTDKEVGWAPAYIAHAGLSQRLCNTLMLCLRQQFGNDLTNLPVYTQKRFLCADREKIKHLSLPSLKQNFRETSPKDPRYQRRRNYLTIARHYMRTNNEHGFHHICEQIEELQENIENNPCWKGKQC